MIMGKKMKLDFTGIEAYVKCAEGQHVVKLTAIEDTESQAGNDMLSATFKVVKGQSTGAVLYDNFVLTDKALWKLQSFLIAVGMKAEGRMTLDLDKLIGKTCIVEVAHEEYEGKTRAKIQEFKKLSAGNGYEPDEDEDDFDDNDSDEEEAPKKSKPSKKPAKKPSRRSDDEDDDFDDDDWEEDDE